MCSISYIPHVVTRILSPCPVRCSLHLAVVDRGVALKELKSPVFTHHERPSDVSCAVPVLHLFPHARGLFCTSRAKYTPVFPLLFSVSGEATRNLGTVSHCNVNVWKANGSCSFAEAELQLR